MNECGSEKKTCTGDGLIACECTCDNCEDHDLECEGCAECDQPPAEDAKVWHQHVWQRAVDPAYTICVAGDCPIRVQPTA